METRTSRCRRPAHAGELLNAPVAVAAALIALLGTGAEHWHVQTARAQDEVKDYRKPILTVETGGHHARVRSLLWQDNVTLLSGGEDKVVKVWDFQDRPRLARSIRPPIWRGPAGTIYAMAASPPDGQGQSILAVGGFGVENRRGDLTIFRIPGRERVPTGEVIARLLPPERLDPREIGHRDSVLCLDFDPSGRFLASGGRVSQTIHQPLILWERNGDDFRPRAALGERERIGEIRSLKFSRDGRRLATGGADGALRVWDFVRGVQVGIGPAQHPSPINTLAYSPDGRSIAVGHEGGRLFRFDLADQGQLVPADLGTRPEQGPVESLAYSPDGRFLAVSIKSDRADTIDPMTMACDLELRAMPQGNLLRRWRIAGLIHATAFSPDGRLLAYSAGPAQSIFVQDMNELRNPPAEIRGQGSTPFDLGFTRDSQAVGFIREPIDRNRPPATYEGFDFSQRRALNVPRNELTFGLRTYNGWSVEGSISRYDPQLVGPGGRRLPLDLNRETERNWWSWAFIPPGPEHQRPTVAIGCESGVVIYDLETGRRTRVFTGHSSPVVSLVASPDGRWLASGSLDQTVMIYPLAGCDTLPGLGAGFRQRPDGSWEVARLDPGGFAAGMGLLPADVILAAGVERRGTGRTDYRTSQEIAAFLGRVDGLAPHLDVIAVWVKRLMFFPPPLGVLEVPMPLMGTTKRNSPALTLMLGADKEWVVWTPRGYYDTSIEGDSRYLGWHLNADYRTARPTDFVPIGAFAGTMMQPVLLQRLWITGDARIAPEQANLKAAAAPPEREAYDQPPPRIAFSSVEQGIRLPAPGVVWLVSVPNPQVGLTIHAAGTSKIGARRVTFDERALELARLAEPKDMVTERIQVQLAPNRRVRLAVEAANENGSRRVESIDMVYVPPPDVHPPEAPKPRLHVLGLGLGEYRDRTLLPAIPFAARDAESLSRFVNDHLVSPDGARTAQDPDADRTVLTGEKASAEAIGDRLEKLGEWMRSGRIRKGDIVVLVIAAHVLQVDGASAIAATDTEQIQKSGLRPLIPARDLSERLGELAQYGCRVVLFLDGVHELAPASFAGSIKPWVRDLQRERRVITFVASREGPSGVDVPEQHGRFALGVTNAFRQVVAAGKAQDQPLTLGEFGRAVRQMVLDLSGRQQEAFCYIPPGVSPESLFARP
ncbi:MAG: WD40 repeat domain-containing protein [Isosphaeraceae bacterium]